MSKSRSDLENDVEKYNASLVTGSNPHTTYYKLGATHLGLCLEAPEDEKRGHITLAMESFNKAFDMRSRYPDVISENEDKKLHEYAVGQLVSVAQWLINSPKISLIAAEGAITYAERYPSVMQDKKKPVMQALYCKGQALHKLNRHRESIDAYHTIITDYPRESLDRVHKAIQDVQSSLRTAALRNDAPAERAIPARVPTDERAKGVATESAIKKAIELHQDAIKERVPGFQMHYYGLGEAYMGLSTLASKDAKQGYVTQAINSLKVFFGNPRLISEGEHGKLREKAVNGLAAQASNAYQEGAFERALIAADGVIAITGQYLNKEEPVRQALYVKGKSLHALGYYNESIRAYNIIIEDDPRASIGPVQTAIQEALNNWHTHKIKPLLDAGKHSKAAEEYKAILALVPEDERAKAGIGFLKGKWEESIIKHKASIEAQEPAPQQSHYQIGKIYQELTSLVSDNQKRQDAEEYNTLAIHHFGKAVTIYSKNPAIANEGEHKSARGHLSRLLSERASIDWYTDNNPAGALMNAEGAVIYGGNYCTAEIVRSTALVKGQALHRLGRYSEAIDVYDGVLTKSGSSEEIEKEKTTCVNDWHTYKIEPALKAGWNTVVEREYKAILARVPTDERAKAGLGRLKPATVPDSSLARVSSSEKLSPVERSI